MNQKIKKTQEPKADTTGAKPTNQPMMVAGNLQLEFGLKVLGLDHISKKQKVLGTIVILALIVAVVILVFLEDPQLADKLIKLLESLVTIGQLIPTLEKVSQLPFTKKSD